MKRTETDFIVVPENPVPYGGTCFKATLADGDHLRIATFPSGQGIPERANALLVSGRSEFIEKYFEVIADLQKRGFGVTILDWRGQGLSSRLLPVEEKGHINTFETFVSDLRCTYEHVTCMEFDSPTIAMSHSMGGVPLLQLMASGYNNFKGAVLAAPMTRLFRTPAKRAMARYLSRAAVTLGWSRQCVAGVKEHSLAFEGNILTSDRTRHARFRALQAAAPNATIGAPTYGWLKAATDAIDQIHNPGFMKNLETPTLIVSADRDLLIDSDDHCYLDRHNPMVKTITVRGALHEILMEQDLYRDQYWHAFDEFTAPLLDQIGSVEGVGR